MPVDGSYEIVNNIDFYTDLGFLDFLKKYGQHFRVSTMMRRDSVQKRLESESGLSLLEFMYSVLQAYDFWHLFKEKDCVLQIGGSDQLGNIQSGTELIAKLINSGEADDWISDQARREGCHGVTTSLLLNEQGEKFGKSENEVIWVDPSDHSSLLKLHQFMVNQNDPVLRRLFSEFTFLSLEDIERVLAEHEENPDLKQGQFELSRTVLEQLTNDSLLVGKIINYREYFDMDFGMLGKMDQSEASDYFDRFLNVFEFSKESLESLSMIDVIFTTKIGDFSRREIRQLIKSKSVKVNNKAVSFDSRFNELEPLGDIFFVVKLSKKNYFTIITLHFITGGYHTFWTGNWTFYYH